MPSNTSNQSSFLVGSLDMKTYRDELRAFLQAQDIFKDYDFTGSNLSVLIDLLAYNTYVNGSYLNMIGSEMFLDTALLRQSIVSHAKELNYVPRSRTSAVAYVDVAVTGNNLPAVLTIPANYSVTGVSANGQNFNFLTAESFNVGSANNWTGKGVPVYEGRIIPEYFTVTANTRFILQSANVDTSSIKVVVQNSASDTANATWDYAESVIGLNGSANVFFVQGYQDYYFEVTFGDGVIGNKLTPGNIVKITYRETNGDAANGIRKFTAPNPVSGFSNITCTLSSSIANNTGSAGGSERESNTSIQASAPRAFATQGRAVVDSDYKTILMKRFPIVETMVAYGGEEATPPQYGTVIISAKPVGSTVLPNSVKAQMLDYLSDKMSLSLKAAFVDPDYLNLQITSVVTYNLNRTTLTATDITAAVTGAIRTFNVNNLNNFGTHLRFSKLVAAIDGADQSVISNSTQVKLTKKLNPVLGVAQNFSFSFGNPILGYNEKPRFAYPVGFASMVTSSAFGFKSGGTVYNSYIQDDGLSNLYVYTVTSTGEIAILQDNVGLVDYATGKVTITNLIVQNLLQFDTLNIYARMANYDIDTSTNQILLIEDEDVTIQTTGVRL